MELKIPPVVLGLLLTALMWGASRLVPAAAFHLPGRPLISALAMVAGAAVALAGVAAFRRAKTTVNPLTPGASALVTTGIYGWTRNPMYLGMLLVLLGVGVGLGNFLSVAMAAGFIPLINQLQIRPEERFLTERFGADFDAYRSRVRRWL